ncbi:radical SAM protein [Soehngenia saccharolytica]|nr:radical SAM protein [Soehngenia saccharolytica]
MGNYMDLLRDCTLCPRECHVNRIEGEIGYCRETSDLRLARASLHMWEEPCISGEEGSGTVFFTGCALRCVYCQNNIIANGSFGKRVVNERLLEIFFELKDKGAQNINLVTPTHFIPQIMMALEIAKEKGLDMPIVYNTSGYEKKDSIKYLNGFIDIYLPDFKYYDENLSKKYSNAYNYKDYAMESIGEMVRQVGKPEFNEKGMMTKGVIVRHLVLPGFVEDSKKIIEYLHKTFGDDIYISIMSQYTPLSHVNAFPEINRKLREDEYNSVVDFAISIGVENGFIQEGESAQESFIPPFNFEGV